MELKQIITATVALIMICLVAIPLIDSSEVNIQSEIQNTTERYSSTDSVLTESLTYTIDEDLNVVLNGEIIAGTHDGSVQSHQLLAMDDNIVFCRNSASTSFFFIYTTTTTYSLKSVTFNVDGTWSGVDNSTSATRTGEYSNLVYACNNGNLGIFAGTTLASSGQVPAFWANNDAELHMLVTYYDTNVKNVYLTYKGTMDSMALVQSYVGSSANASYDPTPEVIESTPYSKEIRFSNLITINDESKRVWNVQVVAPLEYTGYTNNDSIVISLIDIIPVLLIAALLISIGYTIMRRD